MNLITSCSTLSI